MQSFKHHLIISLSLSDVPYKKKKPLFCSLQWHTQGWGSWGGGKLGWGEAGVGRSWGGEKLGWGEAGVGRGKLRVIFLKGSINTLYFNFIVRYGVEWGCDDGGGGVFPLC